MTPSEILQKHEDANEMHFHEVDRKWIIEAMEEYASLSKKEIVEISDEQIVQGAYWIDDEGKRQAWECGAKWYREQLKSKQ